MSETTAVEEREQTTTPDANLEAGSTPAENIAPPSDDAAAAAVQAEAGASTDQADAAATEDQAESGFEAASRRVRGKKADTKAEAQLPGRSLDDEWNDSVTQNATRYYQIMQQAELQDMQPFLREQLGLDAQTATQVWQKLRPYFAELHSNNSAQNISMLNTLLGSALSDEEKAELGKRSYTVRDEQGRIKPYSTQGEGLKLALSLREQSINNQWQAKLDSGDLFTKDQAEALFEGGKAEGRSEAEGTARNGSSGQPMGGGGSGGKRRFGAESELDAAFNRGEIDRPVYAAEKERLTGRKLA